MKFSNPRSLLLLWLLSLGWSCATTKVDQSAAQPAQAAAPGPKRFAIIGDFGWGGADEASVANLVHSWKPDFIVTTGDNNYPDGTDDTIDDNIGKFYHDYIRFDPTYVGAYKAQPPAKPNRFYPTLGNHDWRTPGALPYLHYFDLPGNERYYQVRLGDIELFAVDSDSHEPDGNTPDSAQATWLKGALAASSAPYKIITLHHPPYSSGEHGDNPTSQWPFAEWGATAVMAGHDHHYERLTINKFPYFIIGTGGAPLYEVNEDKKLPEGSADHFTYHAKHGAVLLQVEPQGLTFQFYTVDNELVDTFKVK